MLHRLGREERGDEGREFGRWLGKEVEGDAGQGICRRLSARCARQSSTRGSVAYHPGRRRGHRSMCSPAQSCWQSEATFACRCAACSRCLRATRETLSAIRGYRLLFRQPPGRGACDMPTRFMAYRGPAGSSLAASSRSRPTLAWTSTGSASARHCDRPSPPTRSCTSTPARFCPTSRGTLSALRARCRLRGSGCRGRGQTSKWWMSGSDACEGSSSRVAVVRGSPLVVSVQLRMT